MLNIFGLMVVMLLSTTVLFAQTETTTGIAYADAFTTFASLVAIIPVVFEFLKNLFGKTENTPNWIVQTLSWVTGLAIAMFGWYFNLGFLANIQWYWALIYGFGATLAANGVADTKILTWVFSLLKNIFSKNK